MLKLLSLNIEGDNHLDSLVQLVRDENPDLISLNEVFEIEVPFLKHTFNMEGIFVPSQVILEPNEFRLKPKGNIGSLILSSTSILSSTIDYYDSNPNELPELTNANPNAANRFVFWVEVENDGKSFLIASTHFTITKGAAANELQRENMGKILKILEGKKFVFCGDFNAPRGGEIFEMLSSKYKDNIPENVKTTLDKAQHRVGESLPEIVVDGLFTTSAYIAHEVRVVCGVSDHCAVLALIERV